MSLRGYDTWLQPRERSGVFDVTCTAEPATCYGCELVTRQPRRVVLYEPRTATRAPLHLHALKGVLPYIAERCPRCGSDEYGPDVCGTEWQSRGTSVEGAGVELELDECEKCGAAGDKLDAEPSAGEDY